MTQITDEMVAAAADAAYGNQHGIRYRKMMRRALEAAMAVAPKKHPCACGGVPANPYPGWEDEQR